MTASVCPVLRAGVNASLANMTDCAVAFVEDMCEQNGAFVDYILEYV